MCVPVLHDKVEVLLYYTRKAIPQTLHLNFITWSKISCFDQICKEINPPGGSISSKIRPPSLSSLISRRPSIHVCLRIISKQALHHSDNTILCVIVCPHFFWTPTKPSYAIQIKRSRNFWKVIRSTHLKLHDFTTPCIDNTMDREPIRFQFVISVDMPTNVRARGRKFSSFKPLTFS